MDLQEMLGIGAVFGGTVGVLLLAYVQLRLQRVFQTKEDAVRDRAEARKDLDGLGARVGDVEDQATRTEEMAESNTNRLNLLEQARNADREMWATSVTKPLDLIAKKLDRIDATVNEIRQEHGKQLGEHARDLSGLGRNLDDVRKRVDRLEERNA